MKIIGMIAAELEFTFTQRWNKLSVSDVGRPTG